jgi:hypothetical protein
MFRGCGTSYSSAKCSFARLLYQKRGFGISESLASLCWTACNLDPPHPITPSSLARVWWGISFPSSAPCQILLRTDYNTGSLRLCWYAAHCGFALHEMTYCAKSVVIDPRHLPPLELCPFQSTAATFFSLPQYPCWEFSDVHSYIRPSLGLRPDDSSRNTNYWL